MRPKENWAIGILQIITLAVMGWLVTSMVDVKERLARIEIQLYLRKVDNK